jgi:hypothetical protein
MNKICLFVFIFILSCSNSDKFSEEESLKIFIDRIFCEVRNTNWLYFNADLHIENEESWKEVNFDELDRYYLQNYYWTIDGIVTKNKIAQQVSYGKHLVKLFLIDAWGDTLSDSLLVFVNEPLSISLLSPIDDFSKFTETDKIEFEYRVNGVDEWENMDSVFVYVSSDEDSLWKEENKLENNYLEPPLTESVYFWGVKAWISPNDSAHSEIRKICMLEN